MFTQATGAIINIILDPIMIFGLFGFPRMEVAGAALATVTGQIVAAILGLFFNLKKNPDLHLSVRGFRPSRTIIGGIYSVGIPSIVMQSIGSVMVFGMNQILNRLHPDGHRRLWRVLQAPVLHLHARLWIEQWDGAHRGL